MYCMLPVLFRDDKIADEIMKSTSPKTQKSLGRKVSNFDPKTWGHNCENIVYRGNLAKVPFTSINQKYCQ